MRIMRSFILLALVLVLCNISGHMIYNLLRKRVIHNSRHLLALKSGFSQYDRPVSQPDLEFIPDSITEKSLFLTMNQCDLLALAKLSHITSRLSQTTDLLDLSKVQGAIGSFVFKEDTYAADYILKRGIGQLSGIVLKNQGVKKNDHIVSFAGTSSKWDFLHALYIKDSIVIDDFGVHGGITLLSHENSLILEELIASHKVAELLFTGHSLGGAIGVLTLYLLKKRLAQKLDGKCVTFASPSPFKSSATEQITEVIGYENILNIIRDADYVHQAANLVGLKIIGPTIYLPSHDVGEDFDSHLKKIRHHFEKNHYITQYVHDLEYENDTIWKEHEKIVKWYKIDGKIKELGKQIDNDLRALEYLHNILQK